MRSSTLTQQELTSRGNELLLSLPTENWTDVADGARVAWNDCNMVAKFTGNKTITASYQGLTDSVEVLLLEALSQICNFSSTMRFQMVKS